jgi:hypothetical protein
MRFTAYPGDPDPIESCPANAADGQHDWRHDATAPNGTDAYSCRRCPAQLSWSESGTRILFEHEPTAGDEGLAEIAV